MRRQRTALRVGLWLSSCLYLLSTPALKAQQWMVPPPPPTPDQPNGQRPGWVLAPPHTPAAAPTAAQPSSTGTPLLWSLQKPAEPLSQPNPWVAVEPGKEIPAITAVESQDQPDQPSREPSTAPGASAAPLAFTLSGPTYANLRALWRGGDWLPQISNTVPVGFGPQGVMLSLSYRGIDCFTGSGVCTVPESYDAWRDSINRQGDAYFTGAIGFGDALRYVGVVITNISQGTSSGGPRGRDPLFGGNQTGFHLSKAFSPDTAVRLGVENWIRWDWPQADLQKNAYGVLSQRIRLGPDDGGWLRNAYLTIGAGNGAFRPLDTQIGAQIAAQRAAGCFTWNYVPPSGVDCSATARQEAVRDGGDFGGLQPIAAAALEVLRGFNLIGEWTGRNLNLGFSLRPVPELGLIITPMFENIVANSDYGVNVQIPDAPAIAMPSNVLTQRARFSIQASLEIKF